ncbi:hypothetical protein R83H12_02935 [Fibrobacteria bacterium R8-3-H12]
MKKLMIMIFTLLCCLGTAFAQCNAGSISTPTQLQNLNQCLGDSYKNNNYFLANDIDLSGITWQPIGNSSNPFSGKLDGKGHKVFGFKINSPSADYVGLFGYVSSSAEIKNISVAINGTVRGKNYVGGLAGYNLGKISNSYVTGNVSGNEYVGLQGYRTKEQAIARLRFEKHNIQYCFKEQSAIDKYLRFASSEDVK